MYKVQSVDYVVLWEKQMCRFGCTFTASVFLQFWHLMIMSASFSLFSDDFASKSDLSESQARLPQIGHWYLVINLLAFFGSWKCFLFFNKTFRTCVLCGHGSCSVKRVGGNRCISGRGPTHLSKFFCGTAIRQHERLQKSELQVLAHSETGWRWDCQTVLCSTDREKNRSVFGAESSRLFSLLFGIDGWFLQVRNFRFYYITQKSACQALFETLRFVYNWITKIRLLWDVPE